MRMAVALLSIALVAASAGAQTLDIVYVDGRLEISESAAWRELVIGDRVPAAATLRLGKGSYAELSGGGRTVTLHKEGQYRLSELVQAGDKVATWSVASVIGSKLSALGGQDRSVEAQAAQMGVRGAAQGQDQMTWMEDEASEILKEAIRLLAEGGYAGARALLQEAIDVSLDDAEAAEYLFYAAYADEMMGNRRGAIRLLQQSRPEPQADYYGDYALLKGRILVETLAFDDGLRVLEDYLKHYPEGTTAQAALILAALAQHGKGNRDAASVQLRRARDMNPDTPAGRRAAELITRL